MSRHLATLFFAVLILLQAPSVRSWEDLTEQALTGWIGHELEAEVTAFHRDFNFILLPATSPQASWSADEISALRKGAQALPRELLDAVGRPVFLERSSQVCLFGIGRASQACPIFDRRKKTFYLYEIPALQGDEPLGSLAILTREEQRDLQRRRAIVHLVMTLVDDAQGWSKQRDWRAINGWPRRRGEPLNIDPWGYSRYLGMRSAQLDLVTFAEEYFVRPEDILLESGDVERLAALDPNQTVSCQQFTKSRILRNKLSELVPGWHEPTRRLPAHDVFEDRDGALCPEFETWANAPNIDGVDLLLAAATSRPQSLYGHLLLHVRYRSDGPVVSQGFEPVYQFGAVTDTNISPIDYFGRGLMGGFRSVIEYNTFRGIDRLILQYEERSLRRYTLNLTEPQTRQVLERIWEAERRIIYPYAFLTRNCASFILDLLEPALDVDMPRRRGRIMAPSDVLDYLANLDDGNGTSLLKKRPDDLLSTREQAQDAVHTRQARFAALLEAATLDRTGRTLLTDLARRLDDRDSQVRAEAYAALEPLLLELMTTKATADLAIDVLYESIRIERFFMEAAYYARRSVYARAHTEPFQMSAEEQLELRRKLYRLEDLDERTAARNHWATMSDERLRHTNRRPFTPEEQAIIDAEARTRRVYLAALDLQATLIDAAYPGTWDGVAYLEARAALFEQDILDRDTRSKLPSGKSRIVVGASALTSSATSSLPGAAPVLDLSYSYIYDRLGELRNRGYRADLEARNLAIDLQIPLGPDALHNIAAEGVFFRYMTVERKAGPIKKSWRDGFGWGADIRARHDGRRDLFFGGALTAQALYPLAFSRHGANHLVTGLGLQARYDIAPTDHLLAGPQLELLGQLHLYGHYANVLRLELRAAQLASFPAGWHQDYTARLATEHALFAVGQHQFILSPHLEFFSTTLDYRPDASASPFTRWQAGLRAELPF